MSDRRVALNVRIAAGETPLRTAIEALCGAHAYDQCGLPSVDVASIRAVLAEHPPTAPGTWVCDGCMRRVVRWQIHDMADGEHVLCQWCSASGAAGGVDQ